MAYFVIYNEHSGRIRMKGQWPTSVRNTSVGDILPNAQDVDELSIKSLTADEFEQLKVLQEAIIDPETKDIVSSRIISSPPSPQGSINKVGIVTPYGHITGTTVYALNLAEGLNNTGLDVRIVCYANFMDHRVKAEAKDRGIRLIHVKRDDKDTLIAEMNKVNAVIFHGSKRIGDAISEMEKRPKTIFTLHMESDIEVRRYCDAIVDETVAVAKWLSEAYDGKCRVVPTGAKIKDGNPPILPGLTDSAVVYIGRVASGKNVKALIESYVNLPSKVSIVIVGEGDQLQECKEMAENPIYNDRVHFIEDAGLEATKYLSIASAFVLPSSSEGNSVALIEAMHAGVPIVTTRVGAAEELANMGAQLNYTTAKPPHIAKTIRQCLKTQARRRAKQNIELAEEKLDVSSMAGGYLELLPELSTFSANRLGTAYRTQCRPTNTNPVVSVIMPCYNYAHYMDEAIESVLEQSWEDFELVLINDGSTDETPEKMAEWEQEDERIVCIHHSSNLGLSAARNTGIVVAKGDLITYLDPDDVYLPHKLETQVGAFISDPDLEMVWGGCDVIGGKPFPDFGNSGPPDLAKLRKGNYIPCQSVMVKGGLLIRNGMFDEDLRCMEDWDMWLRALHGGCNAKFIPGPVYKLRKHRQQYGVKTAGLHTQEAKRALRQQANEWFSASQSQGSPINLLIVLPTSGRGGANAITMNLLRHIDRNSFNPVVCIVNTHQNGSMIEDMRDMGVSVHEIGGRSRINTMGSGKVINEIKEAIEAHNIDVVHNVNVLSASTAAAETQTPIVHVRHQERYGADIKSNDLSICVCKKGKCRDDKPRKSFLVYNGLDTQFWAEDEVARNNFRDEHSIPEDGKLALWLGRMSYEKGPEHLVELAQKLDKAGVHIAIVPIAHNTGDQHEDFIERISDIPHAIILEERPREQLVPLYSAADFVVSTSRTEANPLVLIEGMLCRSIPVAFDVGGCQEIVFDCYNGLLIPHGNTDRMAQSIASMGSSDEMELKDNSRRMAERVFTKEQYVEQYERVYRLAVNHG